MSGISAMTSLESPRGRRGPGGVSAAGARPSARWEPRRPPRRFRVPVQVPPPGRARAQGNASKWQPEVPPLRVRQSNPGNGGCGDSWSFPGLDARRDVTVSHGVTRARVFMGELNTGLVAMLLPRILGS